MDFKQFKSRMQSNFALMLIGQDHLFVTDVDKDLMWQTYFNSFPLEYNQIYRKKQAHDCSACRNFVQAYGNVVAIKNNKLVSIWDWNEITDEYSNSVKNMAKLVKSAPIRDKFIHKTTRNVKSILLGIDHNNEVVDQGIIEWDHLSLVLPNKFAVVSTESEATLMSGYKTNATTFKSSLELLDLASIDIALELMVTRDEETKEYFLYRGLEHKGSLEAFRKYKAEYDNVQADEKDCWVWLNSIKAGEAICKFKNSSIGSLVEDISKGDELSDAAKKFGSKMIGYKEPKNTMVSKKQIEDAEKKLNDLDLVDSLSRRFAVIEDITIPNVLYADRNVKNVIGGNIFDEMKNDISSTPKKMDKIEEVSIESFIKNILPKIDSFEVLMKNNHSNNLVSLIAPIDKSAKTMFKWNNNFCWIYANNKTDSIKEAVSSRGGKVDGALRFSIRWAESDSSDNSDLDAHCVEPDGTRIYYGSKSSINRNGNLDVDITQPNSLNNKNIVENIVHTDRKKILKGIHKYSVRGFAIRGNNKGFTAEIEFDGQIHSFVYNKPVGEKERVEVAQVDFSNNEFKIIKSLASTVQSKDVWNIKTNHFQKVSMVMYSPNYWDLQEGKGNKHYFFILNNCLNPDTPRGFHNEFLNEALTPNRKVFEILGNKMKVSPSDRQVSGLGFSETQKNSITAKVKGSYERLIKIIF